MTKEEKATYDADGLRTEHYVPFLNDKDFEQAYKNAIFPLDPSETNVRFRGYVIKWAVSQVREVPGDFVECGTYNAKAATFICHLEDLKGSGRKFHLFDTFSGIPVESLTQYEKKQDFAALYRDVSLDEVRRKLQDFLDVVVFHVGMIPATLKLAEKKPVAFLHMDLNAALPTKSALKFFYPQLSPGGVIVFDDYGWSGYEEQREVVDAFFVDKPEEIFALPTGQGLVVKKFKKAGKRLWNLF